VGWWTGRRRGCPARSAGRRWRRPGRAPLDRLPRPVRPRQLTLLLRRRALAAATASNAEDYGSFELPAIDGGGAFDGWLKGQLSASPRDSKDTDDFRYLTFAELPPWTELHKSLMRRTVTDELFRKLKDVKSSKVCARLPLPLPLPQQQRPRAAGRLIPDTCLHPTATLGLLAVERHAGRRASAPPWRGLHMWRRRVL